MKKRITLIVAMLVVLPASAHEIVCMNGQLQRNISVLHEIEGQEVPCAVKYEKPSEGGTTEFPWRADNQEGYCEEKADYLAARLASFGWECLKAEESE
jgi:hypothetical protein